MITRGLYTFGTCKINKVQSLLNFPTKFPARNFERHERVYTHNYNGTLITLFAVYEQPNQNVVLLLTSSSNIAFNSIEMRTHARRQNVEISSGSFTRNLDLLERPVQFHMYNYTMQAVDICDNYLHRNNLYIRYKDPKQWKCRFVLTLVGFMLVNTYLKFKDRNVGTKTNSTTFRYQLFFEFVSVTNSSFFTPQSNLETENRRGSKFRCVLCNSPNQKCTRHKCQICHGACCASHSFSNW